MERVQEIDILKNVIILLFFFILISIECLYPFAKQVIYMLSVSGLLILSGSLLKMEWTCRFDKRPVLLILLLCLTSVKKADAEVVINELMQSNVDCLMDDLNEFPDSWIELYNSGDQSQNLEDYQISVVEGTDHSWQLPSLIIPPRHYAVVYCDKTGDGMHTDFRLESGKGGCVFLFRRGEVVDKVVDIQKQPAPNISYGRRADGRDEWGYQAVPTPGSANCGQICDRILDNPVFSQPAGVMSNGETVLLNISLPEDSPPETVIRYTTDGSEPTNSSMAFNGEMVIKTNTVVRAKLFCDGWLSPRSTVRSYLFLPREQTLPVFSIVTDSRYLNDSKIGIYVDGSYETDKKNYEFNWRRPANFEYFETDGINSPINQLGEMRIMGGASRIRPLKSMILYAHKRFGTKQFRYEFFPDQKPDVLDFKSLTLRNAGNDFDHLYMRDAIIQRSMAQHADLDWQAWQPAIIFINGVYKGMLNIRERSTEDNVYSNYGGLEDIDMVENWKHLKEGSWTNYNDFCSFYSQSGHTLLEYESQIDWQEFINLMVMNLYFNNQDFPSNNIVMWRPRGEDGRWRFIAKDTDFGLGIWNAPVDYKTIEWLYTPGYDPKRNSGNKPEATLLFRQMMEDSDFKREFIDRASIYMGDFLNEKGVSAIWDPMLEKVEAELQCHRKLYGQNWASYQKEVGNTREWLSQRTDEFYKQLGEFYGLGAPIPLTIETEGDDSPALMFNGVRLSSNTFDGHYYVNRRICLSGETSEGKPITSWKTKQVTNGVLSCQTTNNSQFSMVMPECDALSIMAIVNESGIDVMPENHWSWFYDAGQLIVSNIEPSVRVALYDLHGALLFDMISTSNQITFPVVKGKVYILRIGGDAIKICL